MEDIKKILKTFKLYRKAFGKYKAQIICLIVLSFFGGIFEGLSINTIIPLFSYFLKDSGPENIITRYTKNFFELISIDFSLKQILIFICTLFILKALTLTVFDYIKLKITAGYEEKLRNKILKKTLETKWPYLLKQKIGKLENIIKVDITRSTQLLEKISEIILILSNILIYSIVAVNISWKITAITIGIGGVILLIFKPLIIAVKKTSKKIQEANIKISHYINENMLGIKTIKTMVLNKPIINIGEKLFFEYKQARIKVLFIRNLNNSLLHPLSLIIICLIFAISYKLPGFHFASAITTFYIIEKMFQYIRQLELKIHAIVEGTPYLEFIFQYEKELNLNKEIENNKYILNFNNKIEFKNVNFSYENGHDVLKNISFNIKKGEMVGIIGASGSGKTTIADLLLRLFSPQEGKILIDNKNIEEIKSWRENIGYVSQDIFIKNDTVSNNIKLYMNSITKDKAKEAAQNANIYDFINSLPNKFETNVGEKGIMLSAGQRQRLVIARILARDPKLLILDEATSALDNESEYKIQEVIKKLKGEITTLVIAHRLSTIIDADRLLVLSDGKIIEEGQPKKLLENKNSYFHKLYNIKNN